MYEMKMYEESYYWYLLAKNHEDDPQFQFDLKENEISPEELTARLDSIEHFIGPEKVMTLQELTGGDYQPKRMSSSGSGFYIKEGFVLTNAHVIDSCNDVLVDYLRVEIVKKDSVVDLALLKVPSGFPNREVSEVAPFRSDSNPLELGESVAVFGYPLYPRLSYEGNFSIGNVSSREGSPKDIFPSDRFQHTAPTQRGNSGGPVLDSGGNVVGIVVEGMIDQYEGIFNIAQNINFAVSLKAIDSFLRDTGVEPDSLSVATFSKKWTEIAEDSERFTVPVLCFTNKE